METESAFDPEGIVVSWRIDIAPAVHACLLQLVFDPITSGPSELLARPPLAIPLDALRKLHADLGDTLQLLESIGSTPAGPTRPS